MGFDRYRRNYLESMADAGEEYLLPAFRVGCKKSGNETVIESPSAPEPVARTREGESRDENEDRKNGGASGP